MPAALEERVATFSFRLKDLHPRLVAEKLAQQGIYVWDGNYYALNVTERLGVEESGGMVRVGAVALQHAGRSGTSERGAAEDRGWVKSQTL